MLLKFDQKMMFGADHLEKVNANKKPKMGEIIQFEVFYLPGYRPDEEEYEEN